MRGACRGWRPRFGGKAVLVERDRRQGIEVQDLGMKSRSQVCEPRNIRFSCCWSKRWKAAMKSCSLHYGRNECTMTLSRFRARCCLHLGIPDVKHITKLIAFLGLTWEITQRPDPRSENVFRGMLIQCNTAHIYVPPPERRTTPLLYCTDRISQPAPENP
jgi:hypothetical protein